MSIAVRPEVLGDLAAIVAKKGWSRWDGAYRRNKTILDSFASLLAGSSHEESSLLLSLIEEYDIMGDYKKLGFDLLDSLRADGVNEAIFCPIKPSGETKTKSGQSLIYDLDSLFSQYEDCSYISFDNPYQDRFIFDPRPKILVDDFVGTGDQLIGVLEEFEALDPMLRFDRVMVIAIQADAREYIENTLSIPVQCLSERAKGMALAQAKQGRSLEKCYELYKAVATRAGTPHDYVLGYRDTEALITLRRTPDNTFGIFWSDGGGIWPAPFPR